MLMTVHINEILISLHPPPHFTSRIVATSRQCLSSLMDELDVARFVPVFGGNVSLAASSEMST